MDCPVCKSVKLVMSERQGIEIDYCPQCRGIWLDRGELDKLIDRSAQTEPAAPLRTQQHTSSAITATRAKKISTKKMWHIWRRAGVRQNTAPRISAGTVWNARRTAPCVPSRKFMRNCLPSHRRN